MNTIKYFAYGMNTSVSNMQERCPGAAVICNAVLAGYELQFKKHCDVVQNSKSVVYGVLWDISEEDALMLDALECVPVYYTRKMVYVTISGGTQVEAMLYVMNDRYELDPPDDFYLEMVAKGYRENGLDTNQLANALHGAYSSAY